MITKKWNHLKDVLDNLSQPSLGINQRKSALDDLKVSLEDVDILERIDQNSVVEENEYVTWGKIIYSLSLGIRKDMKLKTTIQSISRIQESLVIIKKCVEKAGLKLSNHIEDVFTIIDDVFDGLEQEWNSDIASYCINILKVVLLVPIYALKMNQEIMTKILDKYMKLVLQEKNANLNDTYCKHINFLVTSCRFDTKLIGKVFSKFVLLYFENLQLNSINNSILSAFNYVLQQWALNHESEKVFETIDTENCGGFVLIKWMELKKDQLDEYISFFQLYMKLGSTLWGTKKELTLLTKLYAHVVAMLSTVTKHGYGVTRTSLGSASSGNVSDISSNFLDLVADVLIRSQKTMGETIVKQDPEERDTKRRKTSTLNEHFEDFIFGSQLSLNWIRAFACVIAKKPTFFKPEMVISFATKLTTLLISSTKEDVKQTWILQCLYGLATSAAKFIDKYKDQIEMHSNLVTCWNEIVDKIVPSIHHQHFVNIKVLESCMRLLNQIVSFRLISGNFSMKIQENIWKLIVSGKTSGNDSVLLLLNFLDNFEFREDSDMSTGSSQREVLMRWLFTCLKKYSNMNSNLSERYRPKDIVFLTMVAIRRLISPSIFLKPKEVIKMEQFALEHPLITLNLLTKKEPNNEDTLKRIAAIADTAKFFHNKTDSSLIANWKILLASVKKDIRNKFVPNSQRAKMKEMILLELGLLEEEILNKFASEEIEVNVSEKCLYYCRTLIFMKNILVNKKSQTELANFDLRLQNLAAGLEQCSQRYLCKDSFLDVIDYLFIEPQFTDFLLYTLDNLSSSLSVMHVSQELERRSSKPTIDIDEFDLDNDMEVDAMKSQMNIKSEISSKSKSMTPDKKKDTLSTTLSLEILKASFCAKSLQKMNEKGNDIFSNII